MLLLLLLLAAVMMVLAFVSPEEARAFADDALCRLHDLDAASDSAGLYRRCRCHLRRVGV